MCNGEKCVEIAVVQATVEEVKSNVAHNNSKIDAAHAVLLEIKSDIGGLKVKAGAWGAGSAAVVVGAAAVAMALKGGM